MTSYDYIVVGAGSSGSVVASRLSARANVLLLESGPSDTADAAIGERIADPARVLEAITDPHIAKAYMTDADAGLGGRSLPIARGIVRGGSSAINGMIYIRGNRRDYDHWAALGNEGWSYDEVLPYFKRSERHESGESAYHGAAGPLSVRRMPNPSVAALAFVEAAKACGFRKSHPDWDLNGEQQEDAAALYHVTVAPDGRRASAAAAFLDAQPPSARLTTKTGARVTRILIEQGRAVGVECLEGGTRTTYRADGEVILSAGAFESPKLLMLSGVGPADDLRRLGITPVVDLPGVGENLHDHLQILVYFPAGKDPGRAGFIGEAGLFLRTRDRAGVTSPDLQYHVLGSLPALASIVGMPHVLVCPVLAKPLSRGRLRLRSASATDDPSIDPNYLQCDADVEVLCHGLALAREFAAAAPLREFCTGLPFAVPDLTKPAEHLELPAQAPALRDFVRRTAGTVWHPVGTCKMGRDAAAVVDPALRVRGVGRLRVADASVIPTITSGNTNAAALMIGERCAEFVLSGSS